MSLGLRADQVNNIVNTLYVANRKDPSREDRANSIKTTDGAQNRIHDDFVTSRELKSLLNDRNGRVALSLKDSYHAGTASQIADLVATRLDRADSMSDGWIKVQDRSWGSNLLREYSGLKNDGYIHRDALKWALESGRLVLGEGGQLLSADEAKAHGDTILELHENKDGPSLALSGNNAKVTIQPYPPMTGGRPTPPPINSGRPVPPPIDYGRPTPPPIQEFPVRSPRDIQADFQAAHSHLKDTFNRTSMTRTEFEALERSLYEQAVHELKSARTYSFADRKAVLSAIFNGSSMTRTEFAGHERTLWSQSLDELMYEQRGLTYQDRKTVLSGLFNGSSMTRTEFDGAEKRLVEQEVDRIGGSRITLDDKMRLLSSLYSASSMTASEREQAARRIEQAHYSRY